MMTTHPTAKQRAHDETLALLAEKFTYFDAQWSRHNFSADLPKRWQTIQMLELKEQLVSRIRETEEPGFEMLLTPCQIKDVELTSTGRMFYDLINLDPFQPISSQYEIGEGAKLFDSHAEKLELQFCYFTGQAASRQCPQGPSEGEYVNGFIAQIRKAAKKAAFQKRCTERADQSMKAYGQMSRLIRQLANEFPSLCGQWITLEYKPNAQPPHAVSLPESVADFEGFRDGIQGHDWSIPSVGHIWIRHYTSETSYRVLLLQLYAQSLPSWHGRELERLAQLWGSITREHGQFVPGYWFDNQQALTEFLRKQMLGENILRLRLNPKHPGFGCFKPPAITSEATRTIGQPPCRVHLTRPV